MLLLLGLLACDQPEANDPADTDIGTDDTETETEALPLPDLCINEYMPSNNGALVLPDTTAPDWIELHNPTAADISLAGWTISDDGAMPAKHALDASLTVVAGGFLLLYADGDVIDGVNHLGFALAKAGEQLVLTDPEGRQELLDYGPAASNFSYAARPDCCRQADCWVPVSGGTPGATNGGPP